MPKKSSQSNIEYHDDIEQGSEIWKELRKGKISGSTAHKLLGKTLPKLESFNNSTSFTGNYATRRGQLLESEAISLYEQIRGVKVSHTGYVTNTKFPNCLYSPDGYLEDRIVEVKCFLPKNHLATIEKPATKILAQVHFGMLIMEKPQGDLILYCPKSEIPVNKMLVIKNIPAKESIRDNFIRRIEAINGQGKVSIN